MNEKVAATFSGEKTPNWCHYQNSGKHTLTLSRVHYHEFHGATTGIILWLIKVIEPLKCARFSEKQRVIWKQAERQDSLKTCRRKTCQLSLDHII